MPVHPATTAMAGRHRGRTVWLTALSVTAVAVHLYGLYRVTGPPSPPWLPMSDKVQHLVGFWLPALLVLLTVEAYARRSGHVAGMRPLGVVVGIFALHAVVSEVIQHVAYVDRSGDPFDALADLVGLGLAVAVFVALRRGSRRRRERR